ncbi:MAG: hypothetical protein IPI42_07705 [Saprospiraceae bacterium]|nr:hypothetical protein [Candidatus Parvibacillus calidus]
MAQTPHSPSSSPMMDIRHRIVKCIGKHICPAGLTLEIRQRARQHHSSTGWLSSLPFTRPRAPCTIVPRFTLAIIARRTSITVDAQWRTYTILQIYLHFTALTPHTPL